MEKLHFILLEVGSELSLNSLHSTRPTARTYKAGRGEIRFRPFLFQRLHHRFDLGGPMDG